MPSPIITINNQNSQTRVAVAPNSLVTIALADTSDVAVWKVEFESADGYHYPNLAAMNTALAASINQATKTASFTAPVHTAALILKSTINNGVDPMNQNARKDEYINRCKVVVLSPQKSLEYKAIGETTEGSATEGWLLSERNNIDIIDAISGGGAVPDASSTEKGKIQLTSDLGGTASAPQVMKIQGVAITGAPVAGASLYATSGTSTTWGALNLAGGSNYVTGVLPATNVQQVAATSSVTGGVRLAGDIAGSGGSATAPKVSGIQGVVISATAPTSGQALIATSGTAATWQAISGSTPVASGTVSGTITLAGDLGGSSGAAPSVLKVNGTSVPSAPSAGQVLTASSGTVATWAAPVSATSSLIGGVRLTGDLAGLSSSATAVRVGGLQGIGIAATTPTTNQVLQFDGTSWTPATIASGGASWTVSGDSLAGAKSTKTRDIYIPQVLTTNATVTTLLTIPLTNTAVSKFIFEVSAVQNGNPAEAAGFDLGLTIRGQSGSFYIVGGLLKNANETTGTMDCDYQISGSNLLIRITGIAGTNIGWTGFYDKTVSVY